MKKIVGANAQEPIYVQYRGFDEKNYGILKKQHIICRNGGTKLTIETLTELAHEGARLIPSLNFY